MTINKNNWFAMYYNWVFGNYPHDICSFFWGSVMIILLAPFLIPGKLVMLMDHNNEDDYSYGLQTMLGGFLWLVYAIISGVGIIVLDAFGYEFLNIWFIGTAGFALGAITLALTGALIYLIVRFLKKTGSALPETHITDDVADF